MVTIRVDDETMVITLLSPLSIYKELLLLYFRCYGDNIQHYYHRRTRMNQNIIKILQKRCYECIIIQNSIYVFILLVLWQNPAT